MTNKITPKQSARLDSFVKGLEGKAREITGDYIKIPNTPDCQPEVMALHLKYGNELRGVRHKVEKLRQDLELNYDTLQSELQKRLCQ